MNRESKARAKRLALTGYQLQTHDEGEEKFRLFVHSAMAFATRMQAIRKALGSSIGLTGTQYTILISIARRARQGGVGLNYISERLHFTPAFATVEVNKLVSAGLVTKKENPEDRRRVLLSVTPQARELLRSLNDILRPANSMLFDNLSSDEFSQMQQKMLQLVDNAERALQLIEFLSESSSRHGKVEPY